MAEKYNANCSICGRPYYKCISCKDTMTLNPWKAHCCSAQHYKVHQVIRGLNNGVYTKDEAMNKLKNIDISDIDNFKPNIKEIVKNILKEDKIVVEDIVSEVIDDETIDNIVTEIEEMVVEKPVYSRKRNYKVNNEIETE